MELAYATAALLRLSIANRQPLIKAEIGLAMRPGNGDISQSKCKINMVLVKNGLIESRLCVVKWPWSNGQQMAKVRRLADEVLAHREMPVE
jgi:hypothetical protein